MTLWLGLTVTLLASPEEVNTAFFDHFLGEVVPPPQEATYGEAWLPLYDLRAKRALATVKVATNAPRLVQRAAAELAAQVRFLAAQAGLEGASLPREMAGASVDLRLSLRPFGPAEGYTVRMTRRGERWRVEAVGADERGAYYAVQSLKQLMTVREGRVVLREAQIRDFPRFRIRAVQNEGLPSVEWLEYALRWMPLYKLNVLAFGQNYFFPPDWRTFTPEQQEVIRRVCQLAWESGVVDIMFHLHPHRRDPEHNIRISDLAEIERLVAIGRLALEAGATMLMLRSDDIYPLAPEDQKWFHDQTEAHIHLINTLYHRFKEICPRLTFLFCPPYYQGYNLERPERVNYLRRLGAVIPPEVLVIWTGPVTRSLEITSAQVRRYAEALGRNPFLWDNTLYAHRSRYGYDPRHPYYLFDTFQTKYPPRFWEVTPGIVFNGGIDEVYRVARLQTADYFWNPEAYEPEASLRRALALVGGPELVEDLLAFREHFYALRDAETAGRLMSLGPEALQAAAQGLEAAYQRIEQKCTNRWLVERLTSHYRRAQGVVQRTEAALRPVRFAQERALVTLPLTPEAWQVETEGKWSVEVAEGAVTISFPWQTSSQAGAFGAASTTLEIPPSPTGKYYLVFSVTDDYAKAGTPPHAWPGYLFKQVLVDGEVVWEDDVEDNEPASFQVFQCVEVTERVGGKKQVSLTLRGLDKRGVGNMGSVLRWSNVCLSSGPFALRRVLVNVPGAGSLSPREQLSVLLRLRPRTFGQRQALYAKAKPFQYFAYLREDGSLTAGVFINGRERSLSTPTKLEAGREYRFAFVYDGTEMRLYLNGQLEAATACTGEIDLGPGNLTLGSYFGTSQPFAGELQEVQVYNRALRAEELQAEAPPSEGLVGWWKPTEPGATVARDYSGSGNEGTLVREWVTGG